MTWWAFALALGATIRLTRLVTRDTLPPVAWFRSTVGRVFGFDSAAYTLVTCVWCASWWLGFGSMCAAWFAGSTVWFVLPSAALTASLVTGLMLTEWDDVTGTRA